MIHYKSEKEISIMREGGEILKKVYKELKPFVKIGMQTLQVDNEAQRLIRLHGGEISFNRVEGYKWATCLTINEQVVHTPPSKQIITNGDILTIDIGVYYKGFHVDYSDSFIVGEGTKENEKFLNIGRETLYKAIEHTNPTVRIGEISKLIQEEVEGAGYFVMRELTGHGVGHDLHEDPMIPGYVESPMEKTPYFKNGMVVAIEVIYSMGSSKIKEEKGNSWSIITSDRSLSASFEHTVAIIKNRAFILT